MSNPSNIEELESLLFDWEEGELDDAGIERVREILRSDEAARQLYVRQQLLTTTLQLEVDAGLSAETDVDSRAEPAAATSSVWRRRFQETRVWLVISAALLIGVLARLGYVEFSRPASESLASKAAQERDESQEATAQGVALLTRLVDVEWAAEQPPLEVGDALAPGRLAISSGFAQVEFFCGATVVVEGPAELDLKSSMLAKVRRGRLRAQVPPAARGFSLEVDDMKVVDLGTEFGLSVSSQGADVQVFDGEVELHRPDAERERITAGQAVTRSAAGELTQTQANSDEFFGIRKMEARADGQQAARFERWRAWSAKLRSDPRLIAYYAFDEAGAWNRKLPSSIEPVNRELDGAIVGARRVTGRWAAKPGLEFKRPGDRVRVQIPGEFSSLTLACWVKIDSLDRWYNSLFLTDNYNQGEPHWQILDTGQLFFSVRKKPDDAIGAVAKGPTHHPVVSPSFWKPSMSGRWLHIATTYEAETGRITHFLNGDMLHAEKIPETLTVESTRIGAASIGNWSLPTKPAARFAIRNLNGSMDEFAIFSAALNENEIREMFENGKP